MSTLVTENQITSFLFISKEESDWIEGGVRYYTTFDDSSLGLDSPIYSNITEEEYNRLLSIAVPGTEAQISRK